MRTVSPSPLILTLTMDAGAQEWFNHLRNAYFPPERNFLQAHLTLFHQLPPEEPGIFSDLESLCREMPVLTLKATGFIHLGGGVAISAENARLAAFHQKLQRRWQLWLTPQDKQKRRFHITVQNKVSAAAASQLLKTLAADFEPFTFTATGLSLWTYKNGPWEWYRNFSFFSG